MKDNKQQIFNELKKALAPVAKKLDVRNDTDKRYDLFGKKTVTLYNKVHEGFYFGSIIIQKNYVVFYFFCIYSHPKEFADIPEILRKCLKGKSCFHITKLDKEVFKAIKEMVKKGYNLYKKEGLI
ncbi:DUF1801 domain-containing protein [Candidatus Roizmanbacteria bacterium]|nr:DUF1801 domain-containing protein [Candidatus Roizmanbacteria bacterium]